MSLLLTAQHPTEHSDLPAAHRKGQKNTIGAILYTCLIWEQRNCERRELRELAESPELLQDIGLSRYDVLYESLKPFWRD